MGWGGGAGLKALERGPEPQGWQEKGPDETPQWDRSTACALSEITPHVQKALCIIMCT